MNCQLHAPVALPPGTHWIGSWVGPRAHLDAVAKRRIPCPCRESNPGRPARSLVTILDIQNERTNKRGHTRVLRFGNERETLRRLDYAVVINSC
jgi:hypothetical protein